MSLLVEVHPFSVIKGQVQPGQALGSILYLHHIDHPKIDQMEGLALRIVQRKVSRVLFNKRIISLDLAASSSC